MALPPNHRPHAIDAGLLWPRPIAASPAIIVAAADERRGQRPRRSPLPRPVSVAVVVRPGVRLDVRRPPGGSGETELLALHDEVLGADDADFARRLGVWRRQPGFALVEARNGGYLVGYAWGCRCAGPPTVAGPDRPAARRGHRRVPGRTSRLPSSWSAVPGVARASPPNSLT